MATFRWKQHRPQKTSTARKPLTITVSLQKKFLRSCKFSLYNTMMQVCCVVSFYPPWAPPGLAPATAGSMSPSVIVLGAQAACTMPVWRASPKSCTTYLIFPASECHPLCGAFAQGLSVARQPTSKTGWHVPFQGPSHLAMLSWHLKFIDASGDLATLNFKASYEDGKYKSLTFGQKEDNNFLWKLMWLNCSVFLLLRSMTLAFGD